MYLARNIAASHGKDYGRLTNSCEEKVILDTLKGHPDHKKTDEPDAIRRKYEYSYVFWYEYSYFFA